MGCAYFIATLRDFLQFFPCFYSIFVFMFLPWLKLVLIIVLVVVVRWIIDKMIPPQIVLICD